MLILSCHFQALFFVVVSNKLLNCVTPGLWPLVSHTEYTIGFLHRLLSLPIIRSNPTPAYRTHHVLPPPPRPVPINHACIVSCSFVRAFVRSSYILGLHHSPAVEGQIVRGGCGQGRHVRLFGAGRSDYPAILHDGLPPGPPSLTTTLSSTWPRSYYFSLHETNPK